MSWDITMRMTGEMMGMLAHIPLQKLISGGKKKKRGSECLIGSTLKG